MDTTKYIREFYASKKVGALVLIFIAIIAVILAFVVFRFVKSDIGYGIIAGLIPIASIQLMAGLVTLIVTIRRPEKLITESQLEHAKVLDEEQENIDKTHKRKKRIHKLQEIVFAISFILIFLGLFDVINKLSLGFAMAILLQTAVMIAYDLFATRQVEEYLRRLKRINNS